MQTPVTPPFAWTTNWVVALSPLFGAAGYCPLVRIGLNTPPVRRGATAGWTTAKRISNPCVVLGRYLGNRCRNLTIDDRYVEDRLRYANLNVWMRKVGVDELVGGAGLFLPSVACHDVAARDPRRRRGWQRLWRNGSATGSSDLDEAIQNESARLTANIVRTSDDQQIRHPWRKAFSAENGLERFRAA